MRLFSISNVLLLLVVLATHEGAHLDGMLSRTQMQWIHEGAQVVMTGQLSPSAMALIAKTAQKQAARAVPLQATVRNFQPFDYSSGMAGGGVAPIGAGEYVVPAAPSIDVATIVTNLLSNMDSSGGIQQIAMAQ